jgi:membrane-bound lytic murein transglycosylase A
VLPVILDERCWEERDQVLSLAKDTLTRVKAPEVRRTLASFVEALQKSPSRIEFEAKVRERFEFQRMSEERVLFTGYYKPILRGRLTPDRRYRHPLYRAPRVIPQMTREKLLSSGVLKGLEIVWLDDPLEAFLAQVQGSTDVLLEDDPGKVLHLSFAGGTDYPYVSIGAELIRDGRLKSGEAAIPQIKRFFAENPAELESYLNRNNRFVFFRENSNGGTVGALGVALVPERSVAVDPSSYPLGSILYYQARVPVRTPTGWGEKEVTRFALAQDKGSAIQGPRRIDIFIGQGEGAGEIAGRLRSEGQCYLLKTVD